MLVENAVVNWSIFFAFPEFKLSSLAHYCVVRGIPVGWLPTVTCPGAAEKLFMTYYISAVSHPVRTVVYLPGIVGCCIPERTQVWMLAYCVNS